MEIPEPKNAYNEHVQCQKHPFKLHFALFSVKKKHPSHPSQPTRRRFSYTPSAMSTRSPVASWISRESRRVTSYGGGTSFEVIPGRLTTKATPHTRHVRKVPKHFIGEKSRKKWRWTSLFLFLLVFFLRGVGWWLNMITFCVGFSVWGFLFLVWGRMIKS